MAASYGRSPRSSFEASLDVASNIKPWDDWARINAALSATPAASDGWVNDSENKNESDGSGAGIEECEEGRGLMEKANSSNRHSSKQIEHSEISCDIWEQQKMAWSSKLRNHAHSLAQLRLHMHASAKVWLY